MIHKHKHECPKCKANLDRMSNADRSGYKPEPGSITVCYKCAAASMLDDNLQPKLLSEQEIRSLGFVCAKEVFDAQRWIERKLNEASN